jgi:hypothetical protein
MSLIVQRGRVRGGGLNALEREDQQDDGNEIEHGALRIMKMKLNFNFIISPASQPDQ